jgi:hypothetical protein
MMKNLSLYESFPTTMTNDTTSPQMLSASLLQAHNSQSQKHARKVSDSEVPVTAFGDIDSYSDCPDTDMISLSESRSDCIDGESLTSSDWEDLLEAGFLPSNTRPYEISMLPSNSLLIIGNATDILTDMKSFSISCNSSVSSTLSMDCDEDELDFFLDR